MYNTIAEALHMACIYYFQSVVPVIYGCRVSGSRSSILTLLSKAPLITKDVSNVSTLNLNKQRLVHKMIQDIT